MLWKIIFNSSNNWAKILWKHCRVRIRLIHLKIKQVLDSRSSFGFNWPHGTDRGLNQINIMTKTIQTVWDYSTCSLVARLFVALSFSCMFTNCTKMQWTYVVFNPALSGIKCFCNWQLFQTQQHRDFKNIYVNVVEERNSNLCIFLNNYDT